MSPVQVLPSPPGVAAFYSDLNQMSGNIAQSFLLGAQMREQTRQAREMAEYRNAMLGLEKEKLAMDEQEYALKQKKMLLDLQPKNPDELLTQMAMGLLRGQGLPPTGQQEAGQPSEPTEPGPPAGLQLPSNPTLDDILALQQKLKQSREGALKEQKDRQVKDFYNQYPPGAYIKNPKDKALAASLGIKTYAKGGDLVTGEPEAKLSEDEQMRANIKELAGNDSVAEVKMWRDYLYSKPGLVSPEEQKDLETARKKADLELQEATAVVAEKAESVPLFPGTPPVNRLTHAQRATITGNIEAQRQATGQIDLAQSARVAVIKNRKEMAQERREVDFYQKAISDIYSKDTWYKRLPADELKSHQEQLAIWQQKLESSTAEHIEYLVLQFSMEDAKRVLKIGNADKQASFVNTWLANNASDLKRSNPQAYAQLEERIKQTLASYYANPNQ